MRERSPLLMTTVCGRYCSIQAQLAAQLKLRHRPTGRLTTLYVTELTPGLKALPGVRRLFEDVTIEIWRQNGLLYVLASAAQPSLPQPAAPG